MDTTNKINRLLQYQAMLLYLKIHKGICKYLAITISIKHYFPLSLNNKIRKEVKRIKRTLTHYKLTVTINSNSLCES